MRVHSSLHINPTKQAHARRHARKRRHTRTTEVVLTKLASCGLLPERRYCYSVDDEEVHCSRYPNKHIRAGRWCKVKVLLTTWVEQTQILLRYMSVEIVLH